MLAMILAAIDGLLGIGACCGSYRRCGSICRYRLRTFVLSLKVSAHGTFHA